MGGTDSTSAAYLTIDDAPSEGLPQKLAVLRERDVPAVFFCEGRRLAEYPEHARRAVELADPLDLPRGPDEFVSNGADDRV